MSECCCKGHCEYKTGKGKENIRYPHYGLVDDTTKVTSHGSCQNSDEDGKKDYSKRNACVDWDTVEDLKEEISAQIVGSEGIT